LVNNRESLSSWNGPYIDGSVYGVNRIQNSFTKNVVGTSAYLDVLKLKGSDWTVSSDTTNACASNSSDCYAYIRIYRGGNENVAAVQKLYSILDNSHDSGNGGLTGKIRICSTDSICFKYMPIRMI
tara:strand:- start:3114 stop:3491 length:378 start_codon:yes stop_codon:yes gene_type:complete